MVFVLMNLAVIDDSVVKKTNFAHLGWADIFKANMEQWKN
jgi:hypothetical protein